MKHDAIANAGISCPYNKIKSIIKCDPALDHLYDEELSQIYEATFISEPVRDRLDDRAIISPATIVDPINTSDLLPVFTSIVPGSYALLQSQSSLLPGLLPQADSLMEQSTVTII